MFRDVAVSGLDYLALATALLQRARLADAEWGLWEAADLQWWWRTPRRSDAIAKRFWVDDEGPVAGVVFTDWGRAWGCDPIVVPGQSSVRLPAVWARALDLIDELGLQDVGVLVRDDDVELPGLLTSSGFVANGVGRSGITWMDAPETPPPVVLPEGFVIVSRADGSGAPHPMRARAGEAVEARLGQCSLYDPRLDMAVETTDGQVAGYALFWFDPVTAVGLVEPMRVEEPYQRRGLARAMLATGIDLLTSCGARRLKVDYATDAARALYVGAGFRPGSTCTSFRWTKGTHR